MTERTKAMGRELMAAIAGEPTEHSIAAAWRHRTPWWRRLLRALQ